MKINENFIMREIAGECVIVPTGKAAVNFNGLITVNETGKVLWNKLQEGATEDKLLALLLDEYEIDEETARKDIHEFLLPLRAVNVIEE